MRSLVNLTQATDPSHTHTHTEYAEYAPAEPTSGNYSTQALRTFDEALEQAIEYVGSWWLVAGGVREVADTRRHTHTFVSSICCAPGANWHNTTQCFFLTSIDIQQSSCADHKVCVLHVIGVCLLCRLCLIHARQYHHQTPHRSSKSRSSPT